MEIQPGIRVLIVDDEERFRATFSTLLTKRGYTVTTVGSGVEALAEIKKGSVDVVILDVKMPGMDGVETLREIKRLKPELGVIMLSGHGNADTALSGLREGVFDYLTKPCNLDLLARKISDAFAQRRGVSEEEHRVKDIMVPLSSFSSIREDRTVAEAIEVILLSFNRTPAAGAVTETVHRSILVVDRRHKVIGLVSFTDLLHGLVPPPLPSPPEPATSSNPPPKKTPPPSGAFTLMTRELAKRPIREMMSPTPLTVAADASLSEAVHRFLELKVRRLLVLDGDKTVGVIREQDVFFEIASIVRQQLA